ncbi:MAG: hypothetical protein J4G13_14395 [Dehalococcoidia bacterium]|nr:hypothetical protein [Dehalococcoidia bacterium]
MPKCAACGADLEPFVRTPHTVYVKTLYHIAGRDYHHHIVKAGVAADAVTEVKPSEPAQPSRSNSLHPETVGRNGFTKLLW